MVARLGSFLGSDPRKRAKQGEDDRSGRGARPSWASAAAAFSFLPAGSRAAQDKSLDQSLITDEARRHVRALDRIAKGRGQSLAQLAIAWVLRDERVTSALIGASSVEQLDDSLDAAENLDFTDEELRRIDRHAVDGGINLWARSSSR